jgi:hypothetical protein
LALSQICCEDAPEQGAAEVRRFVAAYKETSNPAWLRTRAEITPWFPDWKMIEPGITRLPDWRPEHEVTDIEVKARPFAWCAVAEKPQP